MKALIDRLEESAEPLYDDGDTWATREKETARATAYSEAVKLVREEFARIDRKLERMASGCHAHNRAAADAYNQARRVLRGEV